MEVLCSYWGIPDLDLFASRLNTQLVNYVSWATDPGAKWINAFSISWENDYLYCFPPFSCIKNVVKKMVEDHAEIILIVPIWATQPWIVPCLQHLIDYPVQLPKYGLVMPHQPEWQHPLKKLRLMALRLSGNPFNVSPFHQRLPTSFLQDGESVLRTAQYNTYIKRRTKFCREKQADCFEENVGLFLDFLTEQFENGLSYLAINTARSAVP